jgi:heme-degrading monooxygenase HmoA
MVIRFDVAASDQDELVRLMSHSVGEVLRRQDGFLDGTILPGDDGTHVLNITRWQSRGAMEAVRRDPEAQEIAGKMGAISKPNPTAYSTTHRFPAGE